MTITCGTFERNRDGGQEVYNMAKVGTGLGTSPGEEA